MLGRVNGRCVTKAITSGGGALEVSNLRLLEDGSERRGAFVSDLIVIDPAQHACGWGGESRLGVSMGHANTHSLSSAAAHFRLVICVSLRTAASAEKPSSPLLLPPTLRVSGGARIVREHSRVKGR